jgi:hypothetical protein
LRVIRAKGLDEADKVLRTSITYRIVQAMRLQAKRGKIESPDKRKGSGFGRARERLIGGGLGA